MADNSIQLLQKIAQGDKRAFEDFFRTYESSLYRFIKSKLNDSFEAADILNETFLDIWRKAGTFEGRSKVSTWLFKIAYYKTVDRIRKKIPVPMDEDDMPDLVDETPGALDCLLNSENKWHVKYCLENLKQAHRDALELAFFEDVSYAEIADIVDCPESTVKTRVFYAKGAMKRCLQQKMGGLHE